MTYVVASKFPNGLDLGGFIVRGAMVGHEPWQKARAPGRTRVAGYEITRGVPDEIWQRWYADNRNGPIVQRKVVMGFPEGDDDQAMNEWCWANAQIRGWSQASQGDTSL